MIKLESDIISYDDDELLHSLCNVTIAERMYRYFYSAINK